MKGLDFLEVVGEIDETYIAELDQKKVTTWNYKRTLSFAASFLLICTLTVLGYQYLNYTSGNVINVAEMEITDMERTIEEPAAISEEPATVSEEPVTVSEDKNMFEKIFENIVSFFENLRF